MGCLQNQQFGDRKLSRQERCYGDTGIVITRYDAPNTIINRWLLPNITLSTQFRDLKYDMPDDKIYLMPEWYSTTVTDMMYMLDMAIDVAQVYQSSLQDIYSFDYLPQENGVVVSGMHEVGEVGIWTTAISDCNCDWKMGLAVKKMFIRQMIG